MYICTHTAVEASTAVEAAGREVVQGTDHQPWEWLKYRPAI